MRIRVKRAKSFIDRTIGLIGKDKSQALLIKTRFGIHTFGLKFPIDVVVLDNSGQVVQLKSTLFPNKIYFWHPKYDTILELPEESIKKLQIKVGSHIILSHF